MGRLIARSVISLTGVGIVTWLAHSLLAVNATTVGFGYLLFVLIVATAWGFVEASLASILAALCFNYFFLEPVGTFTIADPQNWVALFSFFTTSLIASRLSDRAKQRTIEAVERRQDVERLYTFSRAILLMDGREPFPKQLTCKVADIFGLTAVVLYDRSTGEIYRAGASDFEGMEDQLRETALQGTSFADPERVRVMTPVRLGAQPIASLALQGSQMPDSVLQGIASLVAIGLERARAQDLAHQVEAARQSEQLRTALIDAMAHEFKTPLTSIRAATTLLLSSPDQPLERRTEILTVADEEAERLQGLIDNAVDMARLDSTRIDVELELSEVEDAIRELVTSMHTEIEDRPLQLVFEERLPRMAFDRRLIRLAIKQLIDNAMKYSSPDSPIEIQVGFVNGAVSVAITDHGAGIPASEQTRIFQRFYRSPSVQHQVPGSGLGLSIAHRIVQAHHGELTVASRPGETTFRMVLPISKGDPN